MNVVMYDHIWILWTLNASANKMPAICVAITANAIDAYTLMLYNVSLYGKKGY